MHIYNRDHVKYHTTHHCNIIIMYIHYFGEKLFLIKYIIKVPSSALLCMLIHNFYMSQQYTYMLQ